MLPENVAKIDPLIQNFNLSQQLLYSTHVHGALLDLVFDTSNSNAISSVQSPYSYHFFPFFPNLIIIYIYIKTCADILLCKFDERVGENLWWKQSPK